MLEVGGNGLADEVEDPLRHLQDFLLGPACFFANPDYGITFCHELSATSGKAGGLELREPLKAG